MLPKTPICIVYLMAPHCDKFNDASLPYNTFVTHVYLFDVEDENPGDRRRRFYSERGNAAGFKPEKTANRLDHT